MPQPQQLPSDISELHWRNAAHLHSSLDYFTDDINRLLEDIAKVGISRRVHGRIENPPNRFILLAGAQIVDDGGTDQAPQPTSHAATPKPATPLNSPAPLKPVVPEVKPSVPAASTFGGKDILLGLLGLLLDLPGIAKGFIALVVIVAVVSGVQHLIAPPLTEHSTCQQFEQADYNAQTQVLQQMMAAHGTHDSLGTTRLSVGLYCNIMGPNAPIDGIYNG